MTTDSASHQISREQAANFEITGLLYLYQITLSDGTNLRLFPSQDSTQTLIFGGVTYQAHPLEAERLSWQAEIGSSASVIRLARSALSQDISPHNDLLRGGEVTRLITFASECAPPIGTNGGASFPPETWQIDRLSHLDDQMIELSLQPIANLQDAILPKRVILRDVCQHRYRVWDDSAKAFDYTNATCPYVSNKYFDLQGAPTNDASQDACSLQLGTGCKRRFFSNLPFFGFPGLAR